MATVAPDDQAQLEHIVRRVNDFETTLGAFYRDGLWSRMDRLYHSWTQLRQALRSTKGDTRSDLYQDAMKEFGHELFIPHAFAIVETVLPALLSNRPRILILPGDGASEENVKNMKAVVDEQQGNISLELKLQSVAKNALIYGLGVGKSYWSYHEGQRTQVVPATSGQRLARALTGDFSEAAKWSVETCAEPLFDDPTFEAIPVRDFFWDPYAANIDSARWAAHRTWRDLDYVKGRLADPNGWNRVVLSPEDMTNTNGSLARYQKSVRGQFDAQGIPVPGGSGLDSNNRHEVIEYHDRGQIVTVLNRAWIVAVAQNEANYGRLPFPCYRPTEVPNQFVGKGEIEPIEDLQREINMMRTDRRWSDLMSLNPVLFYNDGVLDPNKIKVGPGELNGVNGDPHDLIWQLDLKGPNSTSYRETAEIAQDIVRTSGISDTFAGGESGSADTATGVQLQMARASARIQNKTHRAELELIKPIGEHWVRLNQRHIITRRPVRVPAGPTLDEPERAYTHAQLGPGELAGHMDVDPDGGSTTPENLPQMRQDAQIKAQLMATPLGALFDPRQMAISILEDLGIKNPEAKLGMPQTVPPETLDLIAQHLAEIGMDPTQAQALLETSLHEAIDMRDQQAQATDHGQPQQGQGPPQGGQQGPEQGPPQQQAA